MAGVIKKKKALFENEPVMKASAKSISIREADGGFIIDDHSFNSKTRVAKSLAAVIKAVKETFAGDGEADDDTEED